MEGRLIHLKPQGCTPWRFGVHFWRCGVWRVLRIWKIGVWRATRKFWRTALSSSMREFHGKEGRFPWKTCLSELWRVRLPVSAQQCFLSYSPTSLFLTKSKKREGQGTIGLKLSNCRIVGKSPIPISCFGFGSGTQS